MGEIMQRLDSQVPDPNIISLPGGIGFQIAQSGIGTGDIPGRRLQ
jgi:hypothetical protein